MTNKTTLLTHERVWVRPRIEELSTLLSVAPSPK